MLLPLWGQVDQTGTLASFVFCLKAPRLWRPVGVRECWLISNYLWSRGVKVLFWSVSEESHRLEHESRLDFFFRIFFFCLLKEFVNGKKYFLHILFCKKNWKWSIQFCLLFKSFPLRSVCFFFFFLCMLFEKSTNMKCLAFSKGRELCGGRIWQKILIQFTGECLTVSNSWNELLYSKFPFLWKCFIDVQPKHTSRRKVPGDRVRELRQCTVCWPNVCHNGEKKVEKKVDTAHFCRNHFTLTPIWSECG